MQTVERKLTMKDIKSPKRVARWFRIGTVLKIPCPLSGMSDDGVADGAANSVVAVIASESDGGIVDFDG